jgi:uncharacterized protein DUF6916
MDEQLGSRGLTRHGLIKAGAAAAVAFGAVGTEQALAGVGAAASGLGKPSGGAAYLHRETYVPLVGTEFRFHRPGAVTVRVKLIQARQLPSVGDAFSLLFRGRGRAGARVVTGIYRLEHPSLGEFDLFLSPVGRGVKGLDLEAVINRIAT